MSFLQESVTREGFLKGILGGIIPRNPTSRPGITLENIAGIRMGQEFISSSELNCGYWVLGNKWILGEPKFGKWKAPERIQESDRELASELLKYYAPLTLIGDRFTDTVLGARVRRSPERVRPDALDTQTYEMVLYPLEGSISQVRYDPQNPDLRILETSGERFSAMVSNRVSLEIGMREF